MAEILLSLTIIGVVAAITLPSLIGNINERAWNTQRKALHARMEQAIAMMPQLNGYGTFVASAQDKPKSDNTAQTFITEGLSKVLKINNVCTKDNLADCGVATTYTTLTGGSFNIASANTLFTFNPLFTNSNSDDHEVNKYTNFKNDTDAAAFETQNGETILLYYNPYCQSNKTINTPAVGSWSWDHAQQYMCANFVYDLNGNKGPNQVGKDVGYITAIYADNPDVVAPYFPPQANNDSDSVKFENGAASKVCTNKGEEYRLPNLSEVMSLTYNRDSVSYTHLTLPTILRV